MCHYDKGGGSRDVTKDRSEQKAILQTIEIGNKIALLFGTNYVVISWSDEF